MKTFHIGGVPDEGSRFEVYTTALKKMLDDLAADLVKERVGVKKVVGEMNTGAKETADSVSEIDDGAVLPKLQVMHATDIDESFFVNPNDCPGPSH